MMKFDVVIGNPPYQDGRRQIYTSFYTEALNIGRYVNMIFPTGWQEPKNANSLSIMNNIGIKRDEQIMSITNIHNAFTGVTGAEWTNVVIWQLGYDNGLDGKQLIKDLEVDQDYNIVKLPIDKSEISKPKYIVDLYNIILNNSDFKTITDIISPRRPYGLTSDIWRRPEKYNLPALLDLDECNDDDVYRVFTSQGLYYANNEYPYPRLTDNVDRYKVFVPKAWGNWSEANGLGGAYADVYIGYPKDTCSETYLECGGYDTEDEANYLAKYLMTRFARALMYLNKYSQNNARGAYKAIPLQDFTEDWWDLSVSEINTRLFDKYDVPKDIREKVNNNIQLKSDENIITI